MYSTPNLAVLVVVLGAGAVVAATLLAQWSVNSTGPAWQVTSNMPKNVTTTGWSTVTLSVINRQPAAQVAQITFTWTAVNVTCVWVSMAELNAVTGNVTLGCTQISGVSIAFTTGAWTVYPTYAHIFQIGFAVQVNDLYQVTAHLS